MSDEWMIENVIEKMNKVEKSIKFALFTFFFDST